MEPNDETAAALDRLLEEVMAAYGRPRPGDAALAAWWAALAPFHWSVVEAALTAHLARCKFAPTPADIVEAITVRDGRPGPEEAWSIALRATDETETVVWTAEIAAARAVAEPILTAGDEVGARKAFLEVYARETADARRQLQPVRWEVSLGTDRERRRLALCEAERQGRLGAATLARLLPPDAPGASRGMASVVGLLAGKVAELPPSRDRDVRRLLAELRASLAEGVAGKAAEHRRRAAERRAREQAAAAGERLQAQLRAHRRLVLLRRSAVRKAQAGTPSRPAAAQAALREAEPLSHARGKR